MNTTQEKLNIFIANYKIKSLQRVISANFSLSISPVPYLSLSPFPIFPSQLILKGIVFLFISSVMDKNFFLISNIEL